MLSEDEILSALDNTYSLGFYYFFIPLAHPYSYLIDSRLNIFRGEQDKWAVAAEILGYSPRCGAIELQIYYYGNCLINLKKDNNKFTNYYSVYPIEDNSYIQSIDEPNLKAEAEFWLVKNSKIKLSHNKQDYLDAGIELKEFEPGEIGIEEAARLAIVNYHELFRATDDQLYNSIPKDLQKILVLDEWYHKEYHLMDLKSFSDEQLKYTFEFNKNLTGLAGMDFETFKELNYAKESRDKEYKKNQWEEHRPSSYETWQQLAKVIATGDASFYKPTLPANTHWSNWPQSGLL